MAPASACQKRQQKESGAPAVDIYISGSRSQERVVLDRPLHSHPYALLLVQGNACGPQREGLGFGSVNGAPVRHALRVLGHCWQRHLVFKERLVACLRPEHAHIGFAVGGLIACLFVRVCHGEDLAIAAEHARARPDLRVHFWPNVALLLPAA